MTGRGAQNDKLLTVILRSEATKDLACDNREGRKHLDSLLVEGELKNVLD